MTCWLRWRDLSLTICCCCCCCTVLCVVCHSLIAMLSAYSPSSSSNKCFIVDYKYSAVAVSEIKRADEECLHRIVLKLYRSCKVVIRIRCPIKNIAGYHWILPKITCLNSVYVMLPRHEFARLLWEIVTFPLVSRHWYVLHWHRLTNQGWKISW